MSCALTSWASSKFYKVQIQLIQKAGCALLTICELKEKHTHTHFPSSMRKSGDYQAKSRTNCTRLKNNRCTKSQSAFNDGLNLCACRALRANHCTSGKRLRCEEAPWSLCTYAERDVVSAHGGVGYMAEGLTQQINTHKQYIEHASTTSEARLQPPRWTVGYWSLL